MDRLKRQLSIDQSSNEKKKKLSKIIDDKKKSMTTIENLSNEIFFEIFDYLDVCDIFDAFSYLNFRLQNLLNSPTLLLKMKYSYQSKWSSKHQCTHLIIPNKHRIVSLHMMNSNLTALILKFFTINASFNCLQSIIFYTTDSDKLENILISLSSLPCLFSLTINHKDTSANVNHIYKLVFALPKLKYCKILLNSSLEFSLPAASNKQLSPIEHLVLDKSWNLEELIILLSYTPRLHRLVCQISFQSNKYIPTNILVNLTHMTSDKCSMHFETFEIFMKNISSQLRVLRINTEYDSSYLDADRWEHLISKYMPCLCIFDVQYSENVSDNFKVTSFHTSMNRFNSSFWIKRHWFLQLKIIAQEYFSNIIIYSIGSIRKRWYDFSENFTEDGLTSQNVIQHDVTFNQQNLLSEIIQPTLSYHSSNDWNMGLMDRINPILITSEITRLFVDYEISITILSDLIHRLPNLISLILRYFSPWKTRFVSNEEGNMDHSKMNNNKILKIHLENLIAVEQVESLIDLCPSIEYLEIMYITRVTLQSLLQLILRKHAKDILHNFTLCLKNYQAKDETIRKLQRMINAEKQNDSCMVRCAYDNIYLECKY